MDIIKLKGTYKDGTVIRLDTVAACSREATRKNLLAVALTLSLLGMLTLLAFLIHRLTLALPWTL